MQEVLGGAVALLILKEVFAFIKLRKNGSNSTVQQTITILNEQTVLMKQQALILLDIKEVNKHNGQKLDSLTNQLGIAMDRQVTIRDVQKLKGV